MGLAPRRLRCTKPFGGGGCIVTNFGDNSITVITSDGAFGSGFDMNTVAVGEGPVGGDVIAVAEGVGSAAGDPLPTAFRAVTTGFSDNSLTVTDLNALGGVVDQQTFAAPEKCVSPGHAVWLDAGRFAATWNGSDTLVVVALCPESRQDPPPRRRRFQSPSAAPRASAFSHMRM